MLYGMPVDVNDAVRDDDVWMWSPLLLLCMPFERVSLRPPCRSRSVASARSMRSLNSFRSCNASVSAVSLTVII
jgi:hypothetical protein